MKKVQKLQTEGRATVLQENVSRPDPVEEMRAKHRRQKKDNRKLSCWIKVSTTVIHIFLRVFCTCHHFILFLGGHLGRDKTVEKICMRFHWKKMTEDIREYVQSCEKCQRMNTKFVKSNATASDSCGAQSVASGQYYYHRVR